ncbi:MAG: Txe/YoeB family addiction module toxin [Spirochaetales bacterium]|nr:Txe/YoeB family addiction module toxin [Candidatus Physcosoma equi]
MVSYKIVYTKDALKDVPKLKSSGLSTKALNLIELLKDNPFQTPPTYEKLVGNLHGAYSRRINIQHRLVYQVYEAQKTIKIISMWSHNEF